jgi:hypothetical protein
LTGLYPATASGKPKPCSDDRIDKGFKNFFYGFADKHFGPGKIFCLIIHNCDFFLEAV